MYRTVIRIMMSDMWINITKKKSDFIFWIILNILIIRDIMGITGVSNILMPLCIFSVSLILGNIPLRICEAVYVCPVDDKGKMQYLAAELGTKTGIGFLLMCAILSFSADGIFSGNDIVFNIAQALLCLFTILNMNLDIGTGDAGGRKVDARGYRVQSKAETMIKVYWRCILILEWVFFWMCEWVNSQISMSVSTVVLSVFFMINVAFAVKYIKPFLCEMLSYEDIYCQKPMEDVVQYDF